MLARLRFRARPGAPLQPFLDGALLPLPLAEAVAAELCRLGCAEAVLTRCSPRTARLLTPGAYATAQARFNGVGLRSRGTPPEPSPALPLLPPPPEVSR